VSSSQELTIEHTFAAPRPRVFEAWSSPEVLLRWWGAGPDWTSPAVEIDLRPGGRYRLSMTDPGAGAVYTVGGECIEVAPPERLVYTWVWETPGSPTGDLTTLVTVEFREAPGDRTTVILTHTGFDDTDQRDRHDEGWRACLANLATRVFPLEAS
jgi:uncharacterized protein YndB with AHSA1/START domain